MYIAHSSLTTTPTRKPIKKVGAQDQRVDKWMKVQRQRSFDELSKKYEKQIRFILKHEPNFLERIKQA